MEGNRSELAVVAVELAVRTQEKAQGCEPVGAVAAGSGEEARPTPSEVDRQKQAEMAVRAVCSSQAAKDRTWAARERQAALAEVAVAAVVGMV